MAVHAADAALSTQPQQLPLSVQMPASRDENQYAYDRVCSRAKTHRSFQADRYASNRLRSRGGHLRGAWFGEPSTHKHPQTRSRNSNVLYVTDALGL